MRELGIWLSLALLAIGIVEKIQSPFSFAVWAKQALAYWTGVNEAVRQAAREAVNLVFSIELSWVTIRLVPTLLVLTAIVGLGFQRRTWLLHRLGVASVGRPPLYVVAIAAVLIVVMVALEQSYFPLGQVPGATQEFFRQCGFELDALCIFTTWNNPVVAEAANFGPVDWGIVTLYIAVLLRVLTRHPEEVIFAFVLAGAIAVIGTIGRNGVGSSL